MCCTTSALPFLCRESTNAAASLYSVGLASRFGVRGYPTLKFFRDGAVQDYVGQRTADDLVRFGQRMAEPAVRRVADAKELGEVLESNPVAFAWVSTTRSTGDHEKFEKVAKANQALFTFVTLKSDAIIPDEYFPTSARKQESVKGTSYVVALTLDGSGNVFDLASQEGSLDDFVAANSLPLVATLSSDNFGALLRTGRRLVLAAIDPAKPDDHAEFLSWLREVSKQRAAASAEYAAAAAAAPDQPLEEPTEYVFAAVDAIRWSGWVGQYAEAPFPKLIAVEYDYGQHWRPNRDVASAADMAAFLKAMEDGTVPTRGYQWYNPALYLFRAAKWKRENLSDSMFVVVMLVVTVSVGGLAMYSCGGEEEFDSPEDDTAAVEHANANPNNVEPDQQEGSSAEVDSTSKNDESAPAPASSSSTPGGGGAGSSPRRRRPRRT